MQIVLKAKKEIEFAKEIEFMFNEFYPEFKIKIKIMPMPKKRKKSVIIGNKKVKVTNKKNNIIQIKPQPVGEYIADKRYREEKYEDEIQKVIDKYSLIKSYQD